MWNPAPEKQLGYSYHHNFGSVAAFHPFLFISGGYRGEDRTTFVEIVNMESKKKVENLILPLPLGNHYSCVLHLAKQHKSEF